MKANQVYEMIRREKIIAIVRGVDKGRIINLAEAILAGGIKMLEVTCNTKGVFEMIKMLCEKTGDRMVIGAGTVLTTELCEKSLAAGAKFVIAPDVNPDVIDYCVEQDVAILPGAATATEILTAKRHGAENGQDIPGGSHWRQLYKVAARPD